MMRCWAALFDARFVYRVLHLLRQRTRHSLLAQRVTRNAVCPYSLAGTVLDETELVTLLN